MRVQYISHATALVEDGDTTVLCDPWLQGRTYYGSWAHYPPLDVSPDDFDDVDYIYISHIHPDHLHEETLEHLDTDIPVLVHDFQFDFVARKIESMGFDVVELPHAERTHLAGDLHINVFGADDCDPEVCGSYFGCSWWMESTSEDTSGSTQVDSLAVFDDGESTIVNANDCRWPLSQHACERISSMYPEINLLLVQFSAANFYPQCISDYADEEKREACAEVKVDQIDDGLGFVRALEPDCFMPFGMSMTLAGTRSNLNQYLASPEPEAVRDYVEKETAVEGGADRCLLLNQGEWFDVETERASAPYEPIDQAAKTEFVEAELAPLEYEYESDPMPTLEDFEALVPEAFEHFEEQRQQVGYESDTTVLLSVVDDQYLSLPLDGSDYEYVGGARASNPEPGYVKMDLDPRLFHRILRGPRYAHFDNAQIGSHIMIEKRPDVYERPLYYCLSFLHA